MEDGDEEEVERDVESDGCGGAGGHRTGYALGTEEDAEGLEDGVG